jgi:hypothetical protein
MNIFVLDKNPVTAARLHNDKHCIKLILESAQMLSTAHRVLDGVLYTDITANNRRIKRWRHPDAERERLLLKATHVNHPCNVWIRSHPDHYQWLFCLFAELTEEYTRRYGKNHTYSLKHHPSFYYTLKCVPTKLYGITASTTAPPQAMPEEYKVAGNTWAATVQAYHNYYRGAKVSFSTWKNQPEPAFMQSI